jgi:hypothetical protein
MQMDVEKAITFLRDGQAHHQVRLGNHKRALKAHRKRLYMLELFAMKWMEEETETQRSIAELIEAVDTLAGYK